MRRCARLAVALPLLLSCTAVPADEAASRQTPVFDRHAALATSQGAIGNSLGEHRFTMRDGRPLALEALRGKPLVISLIYTSCHHTCPMITQNLARAVATARTAFGDDGFQVLTIGFDTVNDTPARLAAYARGQRIDDPAWCFLSADDATVRRLADELGFQFVASPRGFDHLAQVTVVDDELRVYAQIYGDDFSAPALAEPLRRISLGQAAEKGGFAGLFDRVRLFCTVYDATSGQYRLDYTLLIAFVTGVVCLSGIAAFVVRAWREHERRDVSA